jgi:probable addiction module antidote protein
MKRKVAASHRYELEKELKDPREALHYLNGCVETAFKEDDPELILLGLYNVAQAQGINKTAKLAKMHRVSLHRMLTRGGNPEWKSLFRVFSALHLALKFETSLPLAA